MLPWNELSFLDASTIYRNSLQHKVPSCGWFFWRGRRHAARPAAGGWSGSAACGRQRAAVGAAGRPRRAAYAPVSRRWRTSAGRLQEAGVVDAVAGQLGRDRAPPALGELLVAGAGPQRAAQVALRRGRTGSCGPGRRRSAGPGRRSPQNGRVTEAMTPTRAGPPSTRNVSAGAEPRACASSGVRANSRAQRGQDLVGGDHLLAPPAVLGVQRHLLDEPQLVAVLQAEPQQRQRPRRR